MRRVWKEVISHLGEGLFLGVLLFVLFLECGLFGGEGRRCRAGGDFGYSYHYRVRPVTTLLTFYDQECRYLTTYWLGA